MIRILVLLLCLSLSACATFDAQSPRVEVQGPQKDPPLDRYLIEVLFYPTLEELEKQCDFTPVPNKMVVGCADIFVQPCRIHTMKQDWATYIHETQHCFHGLWHDSEGRIVK